MPQQGGGRRPAPRRGREAARPLRPPLAQQHQGADFAERPRVAEAADPLRPTPRVVQGDVLRQVLDHRQHDVVEAVEVDHHVEAVAAGEQPGEGGELLRLLVAAERPALHLDPAAGPARQVVDQLVAPLEGEQEGERAAEDADAQRCRLVPRVHLAAPPALRFRPRLRGRRAGRPEEALRVDLQPPVGTPLLGLVQRRVEDEAQEGVNHLSRGGNRSARRRRPYLIE